MGVKVYKILILTSVLAKIYKLLKKKKKTTTITIYICTVIVHVQMIFLFFFSVSPFIMLFSFVFFSQQNHKITHTPPSTTDLYLLPTTKSQNHPCSASTTDQGDTTQIQKKNQKLKLVITHHNTKTQKLKLAITHHRTNKNQMKSNSNINQNQDEVKWGQCSTTSRLEVAVVGRCNWG